MSVCTSLSDEVLVRRLVELTEADKEWLGALPAVIDLELSGRGVRLLHASQWRAQRMGPRLSPEDHREH